MRCTHFQIHFAMIATRERTHLHSAQVLQVCFKRSSLSFSNKCNRQKCKTLVLNNHPIVQKCVGTEIEFPCRHRALWKIANSDSNRQRRPNTMKYSAARRFTALNIDQMRNIICFNTCTMQYQIYYFARGPKLKFKILKISCHLHIDERYRMI